MLVVCEWRSCVGARGVGMLCAGAERAREEVCRRKPSASPSEEEEEELDMDELARQLGSESQSKEKEKEKEEAKKWGPITAEVVSSARASLRPTGRSLGGDEDSPLARPGHTWATSKRGSGASIEEMTL